MRITYLELLNKIKNKEINPYNYYIIDDSVTYIYDGLEFVDKNNTTLLFHCKYIYYICRVYKQI